MNDADLYFFDSLGIVILKKYHPPEFVDKINKVIDDHLGKEKPVKFRIMGVHDVFLDLMSSPQILIHLETLLGKGFRLDHAFGRQQPTFRGDAENLHGGAYSDGYNIYAINGGKIFTSQIQVGHVLQDQRPEDGGLVFIPGSHKSNDPISGQKVQKDYIKNDFDSPYIMCPRLNKGDVFLFTDSLVHGCKPWKGKHTRRNLYYSYFPGFIGWRKTESEFKNLARNKTERQLLRPPYIADFEYDGIHITPNQMRSPTIEKDIKM